MALAVIFPDLYQFHAVLGNTVISIICLTRILGYEFGNSVILEMCV